MKRELSLLAAGAAGAMLTQALLRMAARAARSRGAAPTDPSIPPSESSATRRRDEPGYAQDDADQEPS
jgi:hypothetical protein